MPRTESEWLACSDLPTMLEVLRAKASDRKVRLFAVGCCRMTLTDSTPARSRHALEIAERFADGLASDEELRRARTLAFHAAFRFRSEKSREAIERGDYRFPWIVIGEQVRLNFLAEAVHTHRPFRIGLLRHCLPWDQELWRVAPAILRDVMGNPFRPVDFEPCWQAQNAVGLARAIYEARDFGRMSEVADALEVAGCDDAHILDHCRGPGPHVRGCWVADLILERS